MSTAFPATAPGTARLLPGTETQHGVVGVAHHNYIALRFLLPPRVHPKIEYVVQAEIASIGDMTGPGGVPSFVSNHWPCSSTPAFNYFWIKRTTHLSPIRCSTNVTRHPCSTLVEKRTDVQIERRVYFLALDSDIQRILLAAPRPETIREAQKVLFPDLVENRPCRVLYDFVFQRRDPPWSLPSIGFRDPDSP